MKRFLDAWMPDREGDTVIPPKLTTPFLLIGAIYSIAAPLIKGLRERSQKIAPEDAPEDIPSAKIHPFAPIRGLEPLG